MIDIWAWLIVVMIVIVGTLALSALIYFVVKRFQDREKEDFEKRDY